jgi:hypothetical protein
VYASVQRTLEEPRREAEQQRLLDQLPRTRSEVRRVLARVLLLLARLIDERPVRPVVAEVSCPPGAVLASALRR